MLKRRKGMKGKVLPIMLALLLVFNFAVTGAAVSAPGLQVGEFMDACKEAGGTYFKFDAPDSNEDPYIVSNDTLMVTFSELDEDGDYTLVSWILLDESYVINKVGVFGGPQGYNFYDGTDSTGTTVDGKGISHIAFCLGEPTDPDLSKLTIIKEVVGEDLTSTFTIGVYEYVNQEYVLVNATGNPAELANGESESWTVEGSFFIKEIDVDLDKYTVEYFVDESTEAATLDDAGYLPVTIGEADVTVTVRNTEIDYTPPTGLTIEKELIADDVDETLEFTVEVYKEVCELQLREGNGEVALLLENGLECIVSFVDDADLANGESKFWEVKEETKFLIKEVDNDDVDLDDYTVVYLVDGVEENVNEDGYLEVNINPGEDVVVTVRNTEIVETPGNGDNGNGTPPPTGGGGPISTVIVQDLDPVEEPEEPVVIEPEPEVDVPAEEPEEEIIIIQEPAPALPDTGANNLAIRTLGFLALAAGVTLHLLDRRRIKE